MADQPKRSAKVREGHREREPREANRDASRGARDRGDREGSGRNSSMGVRRRGEGDADGEGRAERREQREARGADGAVAREARREKEAAKQPQRPSDDPEAWLDCVIADCNDAAPAAAPPGGREVGQREKLPRRPSSRASDARPKKSEYDAAGERPERPARAPDDQKGQRPPAAPTNGTAAAPARPAAPHKEVPLTRVASDEDIKVDGGKEAARAPALQEVKASEKTSTDEIEQEKFKDYAKATAKGLAKGHDAVAQAIYSFLKKVLAAQNLEKPVKSNFAPFEFKTNGSAADEIERIVVDFKISKKGTLFTVTYKFRHSILSSEPPPAKQKPPPKPQEAAPAAVAPAPAKVAERPAPAKTERTSPKRQANGAHAKMIESPSHIEEDIQEQLEIAAAAKKKVEPDEVDEEVDYDDDFEEASGGEEEYVPQYKPTSPPETSPEAIAAASRVVRPESMQGMRAMSPPVMDSSRKDPHAMMNIKAAMEEEKKKAQMRSAAARGGPAEDNGQKGFLADYKSTLPKFNLASAGSAAEKAQQQRIRDLKRLGIFGRRTVEDSCLFAQRPQTQHNLFLSGKSVRYSRMRTAGCQTGEDDLEVGVNTDEVWSEDKEQQFPTLTMSASQADSEPSQMLAFLRRTLPLFEASMNEVQRRPGAAPQVAAEAGLAITNQAILGLPERFVTRCIGESVSVSDLTICPEWYGADHALVLYTWPWRHRPCPENASKLDLFTRPLQSLVGLYPLLSSSSSSSGAAAMGTRPARCLFSFCRMSSLIAVAGRPHLIVVGTEMGSLMVWDLRNKPHKPGDGFRSGASTEDVEVSDPDQDIAHFEGPLWLDSAFSTDSFAISEDKIGRRDEVDFDDVPGVGRKDVVGGMHSCEICCVRCSDVVGGDALILALDISGTVSFWRLLELTGTSTNIKLALQGSLSLGGASFCGNFLDACYVCVHPQQQAQFVVLSTSGVRQANRQRSASVADGPSALALGASALQTMELDEGEELAPLRGSLAQPSTAAFNPFFSGLLLVAYASGDLALFDCSLCVPITHWGGAVATAGRPLSVAWSTTRPCVFFVKAGNILDVWDLAQKAYAPVDSFDISGVSISYSQSMGAPSASVCSELYVSPSGHPLIGHGAGAAAFWLPPRLTTPLQAAPPGNGLTRGVAPMDSMLRSGFEKASLFPTLERYKREVEVPQYAALERECLRSILAGIHPLQAWA